jgi:hypothetical protein
MIMRLRLGACMSLIAFSGCEAHKQAGLPPLTAPTLVAAQAQSLSSAHSRRCRPSGVDDKYGLGDPSSVAAGELGSIGFDACGLLLQPGP